MFKVNKVLALLLVLNGGFVLSVKASDLFEQAQELALPDKIEIIFDNGNEDDDQESIMLDKEIYELMSTLVEMISGPGAINANGTHNNKIKLRRDPVTPQALHQLITLIKLVQANSEHIKTESSHLDEELLKEKLCRDNLIEIHKYLKSFLAQSPNKVMKLLLDTLRAAHFLDLTVEHINLCTVLKDFIKAQLVEDVSHDYSEVLPELESMTTIFEHKEMFLDECNIPINYFCTKVFKCKNKSSRGFITDERIILYDRDTMVDLEAFDISTGKEVIVPLPEPTIEQRQIYQQKISLYESDISYRMNGRPRNIDQETKESIQGKYNLDDIRKVKNFKDIYAIYSWNEQENDGYTTLINNETGNKLATVRGDILLFSYDKKFLVTCLLDQDGNRKRIDDNNYVDDIIWEVSTWKSIGAMHLAASFDSYIFSNSSTMYSKRYIYGSKGIWDCLTKKMIPINNMQGGNVYSNSDETLLCIFNGNGGYDEVFETTTGKKILSLSRLSERHWFTGRRDWIRTGAIFSDNDPELLILHNMPNDIQIVELPHIRVRKLLSEKYSVQECYQLMRAQKNKQKYPVLSLIKDENNRTVDAIICQDDKVTLQELHAQTRQGNKSNDESSDEESDVIADAVVGAIDLGVRGVQRLRDAAPEKCTIS